MIDYIASAAIFVQLAFIFYALGFLARDQMRLRLLLLAGQICYVLYYLFINDTPLWEAVLTTGILTVVNVTMIVLLSIERTTFAMDKTTAKAYESFSTFTPGQFRQVMKLAKVETPTQDTLLSTQGEVLDHLTLISQGTAIVDKSGSQTIITDAVFLGEVSFLLERPASASVTATAGGTYLRWKMSDLRELMAKSPQINNAMIALLSHDLARKLEHSLPAVKSA